MGIYGSNNYKVLVDLKPSEKFKEFIKNKEVLVREGKFYDQLAKIIFKYMDKEDNFF